MLSQENKQIFIQHLRRFGVTLGFMVVAVSAEFVANNLGLFHIPTMEATFIGALLGQISQWATDQYQLGARARAFMQRPVRG